MGGNQEMKKIGFILALVLIIPLVNVYAQDLDDDFFQIEYKQKDAKKAMLFSAMIPGAGHFYSNPKAITAYIFPILEIGLWYGYFYYRSEGDDITKQYEQFANQYYSRDDQWDAQKHLIDDPISNDNFYAPDDYDPSDSNDYGEGGHFRLDHEDTQHFYEDIGKYNKYIFGWEDWVDIYATLEGTNTWTNPEWIFDSEDYNSGKWVGTVPKNEESLYYLEDQESYDNNNGVYSSLRDEYIIMRRDAEDNYENKRLCTYGILFNHLLSAIDAARVTRKYNIDHLTSNRWNVQVAPVYADGTINPAVRVSYKF